MTLTYFPVAATLQALISDTSADTDGNPDIQNISATVTFTPSTQQVYADGAVYRLAPIVARTNSEDGVLKTIDGHSVTLVANTFGIPDMTYLVEFTNVVYGKGSREIEPFRFTAPTTNAAVDLSTVQRRAVNE